MENTIKKTIACIMLLIVGLFFGVFSKPVLVNASMSEEQIFNFSSEEELVSFSASGVSIDNGLATLANGSIETKTFFNGAITYLTLSYQTGFSVFYGENELYFDGTTIQFEETSVECVLPQNEFTLFFRFLQSGVRIGLATEQDYLDKVYETVASFVWTTQEVANALGVKVSGQEGVVINKWQIYALDGVISGETENYDPNDTMRPVKDTNNKNDNTSDKNNTVYVVIIGVCVTILSVFSAIVVCIGIHKKRGKK